MVRQGDDQWFNIVKWAHFALLNAEELGVTQANVEEMKTATNQEIKRLLGSDGTFGEGIGLDNDWAVRTSSSPSATTARSSSAISAQVRRSRSPAA